MSAEEIARLRAEVEHWKAHADEAGRGFSEVCKTAARLSARNVELVRTIETLADRQVEALRALERLYDKAYRTAGDLSGGVQIEQDYLLVRTFLRSVTTPGIGGAS